ncbi:hypothetical protein C5167_041727 [Papaver somniferum]|nr:hypothetical protein C5167_041727 [Papaver somniferum]
MAEEEKEEENKMEETLKNVNLCRKEKRKMLKKLKRKQIRKEIAVKEKEEEEARLNDVEEQRKLELKEKEEAELMERQRKEFEEREKLWLEKAAKMAEEEEQRRVREEEEDKLRQVENDELSEDEGWEYVEEGPAEIIWQGNEIIVKKKTVRVPKKNNDQQLVIEDKERPTSNPLPPQSEVFASYKNSAGVSSQGVFDSVAQETPNFGTEQDKANCPFHIKTGACRFGSRCSRVHYYPDKSCTLLIKNMYNGPGLAWEQDEGLEQTDEEVERCFEEFYEDVHTEFLKFGEIVNFKVCSNGSFHLRGNVYVHYKSLESAILAYRSLNGRYFASKQITCEYVGVTKWRVAICGEYMRSRLTTCSRGTACNFIHCFRNPSGDYEWADWDKPPPKDWVKKMAYLFGASDENGYDKHVVPESWGKQEGSQRKTPKSDRYRSRRSRSRTVDSSCSSDEKRDKGSGHSSRQRDSHRSRSRRSSYEHKRHEEKTNHESDRYLESEDYLDKHRDGQKSREGERRSRTQADYLYDKGNEVERHHSDRDRLNRKDSHRKNTSRRRREHSKDRLEVTKSGNSNLSASPGRYDPSADYNSNENIDQCNDWETSSRHVEHGNSRRSSKSKEKESSEKLDDKRNSSRYSDRSRKRKNSKSREESEEDHCHEENKKAQGQKHRRDDYNEKNREYRTTKETSSERFSPEESKRRTEFNQEEAGMIASPNEIYDGSQRHKNGGKRERSRTTRSDDKTSSRDVHSFKHRTSRKRSRSRSPIKSRRESS